MRALCVIHEMQSKFKNRKLALFYSVVSLLSILIVLGLLLAFVIGSITEDLMRLLIFSWGGICCFCALIASLKCGEAPLHTIVVDKNASPGLFIATCTLILLTCCGLVFLSIFAT